MKSHFILITYAILTALFATAMAKDSTWGKRGFNDRLLYSTKVVRKSKLWRVINVDVEFPANISHNRYVISEVRAIDHTRKDGGYVKLRTGGPGYRNVKLTIRSERNHGVNYTIEIYGR